MVDQERIDRLLDRIASDLNELDALAKLGQAIITDRTSLAAAKYYFITAIEGCAKAAQHIVTDSGWRVAESNAEAVRRLGSHGVLHDELAEAAARAVGFRDVLLHEYTEIDDERVVANLQRLGDLREFVAAVARWSGSTG